MLNIRLKMSLKANRLMEKGNMEMKIFDNSVKFYYYSAIFYNYQSYLDHLSRV